MLDIRFPESPQAFAEACIRWEVAIARAAHFEFEASLPDPVHTAELFLDKKLSAELYDCASTAWQAFIEANWSPDSAQLEHLLSRLALELVSIDDLPRDDPMELLRRRFEFFGLLGAQQIAAQLLPEYFDVRRKSEES